MIILLLQDLYKLRFSLVVPVILLDDLAVECECAKFFSRAKPIVE